MDSHLVALLPVAGVWLTAGMVADGLPRLDRVHALRQRTGWLIVLSLTGLSLMAAVALAALGTAGTTHADRAGAALALAALPALVVAVSTVRRLHRLRAGAGAFAAAPRAPVPPGLRAHAAHPLVGLPLQIAGLAMVPAVVTAGAFGPAAGSLLAAPARTVVLVGIAAIGVRHVLRHSRLAARARPGTGGPAAPVGADESPVADGPHLAGASLVSRVAGGPEVAGASPPTVGSAPATATLHV
ncbi:hypothetical protein GA0074692_5059 [Micromonospora pallida]|uniref:Uncharacterized protein n=1 Tax=Micromonospora pallida TaxID=145854 RepID=A0A1C6T9V9_9ACTN|nr:hypothetical protein [Micromonospora pallida]SCL38574.1 hypothetical protein GA0074692_5059 [Micromonospora pallida]